MRHNARQSDNNIFFDLTFLKNFSGSRSTDLCGIFAMNTIIFQNVFCRISINFQLVKLIWHGFTRSLQFYTKKTALNIVKLYVFYSSNSTLTNCTGLKKQKTKTKHSCSKNKQTKTSYQKAEKWIAYKKKSRLAAKDWERKEKNTLRENWCDDKTN